MEIDINDRVLLLVKMAKLKELALMNNDYKRWANIRSGTPARADEIAMLSEKFPEYAYWLATGKIIPEAGQISPDYEETHAHLSKPAGE